MAVEDVEIDRINARMAAEYEFLWRDRIAGYCRRNKIDWKALSRDRRLSVIREVCREFGVNPPA